MTAHKILIVDDSKLARMAIVKALSTICPDWTRFEAANAEEALSTVKQSAIDITLLDYNMPGQDGLALAAELRAFNPGMPVAIISANHQTEIVNQARDVGATFLAKPVNEQALRDFLATAAARLETSSR